MPNFFSAFSVGFNFNTLKQISLEPAGQESIALAKKTTGKQKMVLKNGLWVKVQAEESAAPPLPASKGSVLGSRNEFGEKVRSVPSSYDQNEAKSHSGSRDGRDHRSGSDIGREREHSDRGRDYDGEERRSVLTFVSRKNLYIAYVPLFATSCSFAKYELP